MTHSPGPWTMRTDGLLLDKNGRALGEFTAFRSKGVTAEEVAANRALIQAAPEMFRVLFFARNLLSQIECAMQRPEDEADYIAECRRVVDEADSALSHAEYGSADSTKRSEQPQGSRDSKLAATSSTQTTQDPEQALTEAIQRIGKRYNWDLSAFYADLEKEREKSSTQTTRRKRS